MSLTDLMGAARYGDLKGVKRNLNQVGKKDEDGWTALMYAAMWGRANCIPFLEKEIGMQDNCGRTALMRAAFKGHAHCARLLFSEAGKQTTGKWYGFPSGATALIIAAHKNCPKIVQLLLPYEQGLKDSKGHTAQWHANNSTKIGDFTRVRQLLKNEGTERLPPPDPELLILQYRVSELTTENESLKKDLSSSKNTLEETKNELSQLNQENSSLKQQLQKANEEAKKNHELNEALNKRAQEAEKSLTEAKGENASLKNQLTEMESTTLKQDNKIFHLRTENASLQDQLSSSKKAQEEAEERLSQMNQEMSSLKAQLSKTNEDLEVSQVYSAVSGNKLSSQPTATGSLILAAAQGNVEGVRANLHEIGKQGENGWTALMYAARGGYTNCIPLLKREAGIQDNYGWTALMWPAYYGKTDCVRLLLSEAGKQTTKEYNDFPPGTTALMLAAYYNHSEIVRVLLPYEQGMEDSKGHTSKWYANNSSYGGDYSQVRTLLKDEGTERIPPPSNPAEMLRFQERIDELAAENDSLQKDFPFSKNAHNETKKELSQLNQENSSLKQQLQKANKENDILHKQLEDRERQDRAQINRLTAEVESLKKDLEKAINESKRHAKMCEELRKASDQKQVFIDQLVKEAASLRQTMVQQNTYLTTFLIEVLKTHGTQEPRNRGPMPAGSLPEPAVKREV
ncbi:Ankyrin repeat protein 3 [Giardia muris]|uniref:Ankyrin repeat protein 3 n=1 Tax=Giardia muris TaxID=5742 RepID=A0A4Z1T0F3_GIAMU|nr:Ankyrin repeat protein 3 [Giardia muris]|eukprot:TNJ27383.1 Ankyrin repeat protein 3 [Giardia muris]